MKTFFKVIVVYIVFLIISLYTINQLNFKQLAIKSELNKIEKIAERQPETAIIKLKTIKYGDLKSEEYKTLYKLISIHASFFAGDNTILSDPSIPAISKYYDTTDDSYHKMLSHYYCGKHYYSIKNFDKSIINFEASRKTAIGINDTAYINCSTEGIIHSYIALNKYSTSRINEVLSAISNQKELEMSHISNKIKTTQVIIIVVIALCCFAFWSYSKLLKAKEADNITIVQSTIQCLKEQKYQNTEMAKSIHELISKQFESINNLCSTYYESIGTPKEQKKIYDEVKKQIQKLTMDTDNIIELEKIINTYLDNLIINFKNDMPNLKESDYNLYVYSVLGFSARAISLFINEKIEIVYNRKSRLRAKIKSSCPNHNKYLSYLS